MDRSIYLSLLFFQRDHRPGYWGYRVAITSGAGPHFAFLNVNGTWPIEHGSVEQHAERRSSTFSASIPMSYPGAEQAFSSLGDNNATITVSTRGISGTLFTGEVDNISFDFINRVIRANGRDKAAKLHENMTSEKWLNKNGSDIVSDLAGRVGLGVNVDASSLLAGKLLHQDYVRLSDNVSFAYVIHKLAEFDGARWFVDTLGTLHYVSTSNPLGMYILNYVPASIAGHIISDCLSLVITRNIQAGKNIKVNVKSWHPKDKQVHEYTSNVQGNGGPLNYNYHIPNLKPDHVQKHAKSRADEIARHELRLTATVAGDPSVSAGMGLILNGTSFWDQQYEIDTVHHQIGMSGHKTNITARAPKGNRSAS